MDRPFNQTAMALGIIAFFVILWSDFKRVDLIQLSSTFFEAQSTDHSSSREQPFLKAARTLLIDLPQLPAAEYTHVPVISRLFAPLQAAHPSWSPFFWQLLSMFALILSVYVIVKNHDEPEEWNSRTIVLSFAALTFLPLLICIYLCSMDILFGILPLSLGYYLLAQKHPIKAGLVLALTLFKPQFLLPALFISSTMIVDKKRQKGLVSMAVGIVMMLALDALLFGNALAKEVLRCFQLLDANTISRGIAPQLNTSFSGALTLLVSQSQFAVLKPAIYAFGVFWGSLAFITALRLWQVRLTEEKKLALTFILAIFITPFVVPNFSLFDYSIYTPAGIVALCTEWSHEGYWEIKSVLRTTWLLINIYSAPFFIAKCISIPVVLLVFLLLFYRRLLIITEAIRVKESIPEVPLVER